MPTTLPIENMSTTEKLRALEEIWDDLLKDPSSIPAPGWHEEVLAEREEALRRGNAAFEDWGTIRKRLRDRFE